MKPGWLPVLLVLGGCGGGLGRPLTPAEQAVKFVNGNQNTSIELSEKCEAKGMEEFKNAEEDEIRAAAVAAGANVAQPLYQSTSTTSGQLTTTTTVTSDVRFWKCP